MHKVTIIYCFRDRELLRVKLSLDSLAAQTDSNFNIIFVDYGSQHDFAQEVRRLVESYSFAKYIYNDSRGMVWNRSHALNTAIRIAETPYVFTSDIDMIFKPGFVEMLNKIASPNESYFFSGVMLPEGVLPGNPSKEATYDRTTSEGLGWGLIPRQALFDIGSYDEMYCIWGIEDNDIGHRLKMANVGFNYITEIWMFHYYHPPVPKQREVLPDNWHAFLRDYFNLKKDVLVRNSKIYWGKLLLADSRTALHALHDPTFKQFVVEGRIRFFRFFLERCLNNAHSGDIIKAEFTDKISVQFKSSRLSRIVSFINGIIALFRIPIKLITEFETRYEDVYNARNELMFLIMSSADMIADYAFEISGNTLNVVLVKK